ncbi:hypothetical protein PMKS-002771 [Pichia membranifaciens]|uniref:DNA replication ATP-dependent helicase/nuclease DNA2 n=1 Tax=Pichia membranifaciens TaxID=4926 RepID=A0A1Q2YIB2_9ASCO|nr:hypothetical protein PMKS-002771 [Pichia membranifaciens]
MSHTEERPTKRVKANSGGIDGVPPPAQDVDQENEAANKQNTATSSIRAKPRKFGNTAILDTIEKISTNKKKAMSIAELKSMRDLTKKLDTSKKFTGIIELKEDSDLSMNNESSPFKLIRSSQEFNIDSPVANTVTEKVVSVTTPTIIRTRPSSDDGIFWITTPRSKKNASLGRQHANLNANGDENTVSGSRILSSPLKLDKDSQSKDLPDTLLDPELKILIAKYGGSPARLQKKPFFSRCSSDSQTVSGRKQESKRHSLTTQIAATKNSLNDSIVDSITRENCKESIRSSIAQNDDKVDLSDVLMQIGTKLMTSLPAPPKENMSSTPTSLFGDVLKPDKQTTESDSRNVVGPGNDKDQSNNGGSTESLKVEEEDKSDSFSDDIDMSDLLVNATQAIPVTIRCDTNLESSSGTDDSFSDDDDDLMEKIELGLTQPQVRDRRPNTDQTDVTDVIEMQITDKAKNIKLVESKLKSGTTDIYTVSKFKGMMTKDDEDQKNSKNNRPFQLYAENENLAKCALNFETMKRLQIKNIHEGIYKDNTSVKKQYVLKCLTADDELVNVLVRDHWASLGFKVNDVIHIILPKPTDNFQLVDKDHNLLIWHPDTLLSSTRIAEAVDCKRRSIISQKFNGPGIISIPFIIGNITHYLFQKCLMHKNVNSDFAEELIEQQLDSHIIEIYAASKNRQEIKGMIMEHFSYIKEWITDYITPSVSASDNRQSRKTEYKATNILDIEESIVSPIFGIKGIIDVVIEAKLNDGGKYVIPLEIKTGREYLSNRAQVSLYTLLIKQRYDVDCFYTSLVYTKLHQCYLNALKYNDFKLLINIRNELSQYLVYAVTELPPILQRASCERCFNLEPCMVLNKMTENGVAHDSGIEIEMYEKITSHLNKPLYKEYYEHWDKLITKEEGLMSFAKTDLWRSTAEFREANGGNCVGHLKVVNCDSSAVNNQFVYMFERDTSVYPPLTSSQLAKNDRIILSDENSMFGLAYGQIKLLRSDVIVIITDRNWSNSAVRMADFNAENNQTFRSVLRTSSQSDGNGTSQASQRLSNYITSKSFRIDKDQMFHGMAMARFNLLNLFLPDGDSKSRQLIVELKEPKLSETPGFDYDIAKLKLNEDQIRAVELASRIEDYCLILGMPGTGKTTVISSIVDSIVKSGMTVLISSYTHSAVDNICEKLIKNAENRQEKLPLLRVGSPARISPIVSSYSLYNEEFDNSIKDKSEFQDIVNDCQIVAATCLGLNDVVFGTGKRFDYCIIDEASQVTLPVVLGPIAFSDKFILVGDHYQLPPLVLHPEAKQEGLDRSLFKILSEAHPSSVIELTHQYRMCSDIMSLSNELIYDGRLKCGSEEVASKMLKIPYLDSLPIDGTCIKDILDPSRRVIFVNEDAISSLHEVSVGDKVQNPGEAKLITILIKVLLMGGIEQENIGVMSFYKAQLRHFFVSLAKYKNIEILTADRFQGRDKDVIIISLVRTEVIGDLLKEWRRVNVAMTRAKCKLIIFGSKKLLKGAEQFEGFMDMIESNGWCYDLKEEDEKVAYEMDFLEHGASAVVGENKVGGDVNYSLDDDSFNLSVSGGDTRSNVKSVKRLDRESRLIRRSNILKFVIDDLTK